MNKWKSRLLGHRRIATDTVEFTFMRPQEFDFVAGQHVIVKLPELLHADDKGPTRPFTLLSAPLDPDLRIATRMTGSGFKKTLNEMRSEPLELFGPRGEFTLKTSCASRVIWIAGGIGITPFYSMLHDALHQERLPQTLLIYSNRTLESALFHSEFSELTQHVSYWRYLPTLTDLSSTDDWSGERRRIDGVFLQEIQNELRSAELYLCGPAKMVEKVKDRLLALEIPEKKIRCESFSGY
ncbi:FAD-dependent oxidoreductase [candidate division KSB1 bacterium]|nr:FAD-dependent oxidoreductase [candidate division KSB1 bacterium]